MSTLMLMLGMMGTGHAGMQPTLYTQVHGSMVYVRANIAERNAYACNYVIRAVLADGRTENRGGYSEPRGAGTNLQVADVGFTATVRSADVSYQCTPK